MRLLLAAVAALAAAPAWADPAPVVCRYELDVAELPLADCAKRHARLSEAERSALDGHARARRQAVETLAELLENAANAAEARKALDTPAFSLTPPLNERTFKAWLPEDHPLLAGPLARGVAGWLEVQAVRPPAVGLRSALDLRRADLSPDLKGLDDSGAATRAIDGSIARAELGVSVPVPEPEERGAGRLPAAPLAPELGRPRSDVALPAPPLPGALVSKPAPLLKTGALTHSESLLTGVDPAVSPCEDFFQYACGKWIKDHPLGPSSQRSRFNELRWRNTARLRVVVEDIARADPKEVSPDEKRAGEYYKACMDRGAVKKAGTAPLKPDLDLIRAVADGRGLAAALGKLHAGGQGGFFALGAEQDMRKSREIIAGLWASRGGLTRAYYLEDGRAKERAAYAEHIRNMFVLLGERKAAAARAGAAVLRVETALARAMLTEEEQREPANIYHRMPLAGLQALTPSFPWDVYLEKTGAPRLEDLNVSQPDYFRALEALIKGGAWENIRSYLAWRALSGSSAHLPAEFAEENTRYGNLVWGGSGKPDQAQMCLSEMDEAMGDTLGRAYAKVFFDEESRQAMLELTQGVRDALTELLQTADWMSPETRAQALLKAKAMTLKVGYPDKPDDLAGLQVNRGDAFGNERRADAFRRQRDLARIGRPRDPGEWNMSAHAVNAYYSPLNNEIVFPAGILQPPFFDPKGSAAVNFGAIGAIVGHEMIHGFDDQGCKFDHQGDMRDWWTPEDKKAYMERAGAFVRQYAAYPQHPGGKERVNGQLTLGENIADNGGIRVAYAAYMKSEGAKQGSDGFTPQQSFFLGFARVSCGHTTPEFAAQVADDPHAPRGVRVNATVSNMPEFREAFSCRGDAPMVNQTPSKLW